MYRAQRRFISPWWIFRYPASFVNVHYRAQKMGEQT